MRRAVLWSYSTGERRDRIGGGIKVRVYERTAGGVIYLALFDPALSEGRGGYRRTSLGHADRKRAVMEAEQAYKALRDGEEAQDRRPAPRLGALIDGYLADRGEQLAKGTRRWLLPALTIWRRMFGDGRDVRTMGTAEWREFLDRRGSGAVNPRGELVPAEQRRKVSPGTVRLGCDAILAVFGWAMTKRVTNTEYLLATNPFEREKVPAAQPTRSIWTHDRFERVMAEAERLTMVVEWSGRRERRKAYLADVLAIAQASGSRISAVLQLRARDLRLGDTDSTAPHGRIAWPAATNKRKREWRLPITAELRERLVAMLRERGALSGDTLLFPSPRDLTKPVCRETVAVWLRQALTAAGLERLPREAFHGLRRKWGTERRHLPRKDVAAAGGWGSETVLGRIYQQPTDEGVLEAVVSPRRLRDRRGA